MSQHDADTHDPAGTSAVIGVGDTDYLEDWQRVRSGEHYSDSYGYAQLAFVRALQDAGLDRNDVDGLIVGPTIAYERTAEILGLNPRHAAQADAAQSVIQAAMALESGRANCVALVYGNDQRSAGVAYGGAQAMGGNEYLSYVYYAPWGFTSQGGLYALMTRRYMELTGLTEPQLGEVAVAQRKWAQLNNAAIMRAPLTVDDYLASRYITEPLHLYDYTIINDGGVALIMTSAEQAERTSKRAIAVAGIGRSDLNVDATSLRPRLMDFYHPAHRQAAERVYASAGCTPKDIDLVQIYDSFSIHIPVALAGFGFTTDEDAGSLLASGALQPGGRLPVNTSGGHLSESYMQGWNHQVEAVRQLRHEAGDHQVEGANRVQYISDVAGKVTTLIYRRG
jgi:acetyl-CoA acetyltransferase